MGRDIADMSAAYRVIRCIGMCLWQQSAICLIYDLDFALHNFISISSLASLRRGTYLGIYFYYCY